MTSFDERLLQQADSSFRRLKSALIKFVNNYGLKPVAWWKETDKEVRTVAETLVVEQVVRAPVERVFAVARQVERFPDWLDYVTAIRVLERSEDGKVVMSEWEASVPMFGLRAKWVERDEWDEERKTCRFALQEGDLDKYEGDWYFESHPEGTKMRLVVNYEYRVPIGGALVQQLVRKIVEQMAQKLLEGIAKVAEQSAEQ